MHTYRTLFAAFLVLVYMQGTPVIAQTAFPVDESEAPITIEAGVYWGNVTVTGDSEDTVRLSVSHTPQNGVSTPVSDWNNYVSVNQTASTIIFSGRRPASGTFESIDLTLHVPEKARVLLRVDKGGEIRVNNMHDLVEINHRNGSVELENLRGFAIVSAVNGSIRAEFDEVMTAQSMSFVTLNGGIDLILPQDLDAQVRLRSNKNGYIYSEFDLKGTDNLYSNVPGESDPNRLYSKEPLSVIAPIGNGGPWIIATTENGPVRLEKTNR